MSNTTEPLRQPYLDRIIVAVAQNVYLQILSCSVVLISFYLWHMHRTISTAPGEFLKITQKPWTKEEIRAAYEKVKTSPKDVTPFLFSKKNRRYVVVGGSGLVGGWIVKHLLMRGEDPAAIRIFDISEATRKEVTEDGISFTKVDVRDAEALRKAFTQPWPRDVSNLPLTVFCTVAIINAAPRKVEFVEPYLKINVEGTANTLKAAKESGTACFISTSSGSVALRPPSFFPWPWQRWPKDLVQFLPNADRQSLDDPLEKFGCCYAWSKAQAEKLVREANNPQDGFLTGCIRPSHCIYGHGVKNPSSLSFDYLTRGGSPSWIPAVPVNFVSAENVSIGHLAYENAVLKDSSLGGRAYCVMDPNPPVTYGHLYTLMKTLVNPLTPVNFPYVSHLPVLFVSYMVEAYNLIRHRYLNFLPPVTGDLAILQPGIFNVCTLHVLFTDTKAKEEIGYRGAIETLEGFAADLADWNQKWEDLSKAKIEQGKAAEVEGQEGTEMPKAPLVH